jgi:hypothetical protein
VTGTNRGIGQALVDEALRRGAKRVYAATRKPLVHPDDRVTSLTMDVTNAEQIEAALGKVDSLDILINNAGVQPVDDLSDRAALEQSLAVNFFGTYGVTQAFLPLLTRAGGAIVNVVSIAALAAVPVFPAYSMSKAAAFNRSRCALAGGAGRGRPRRPARPGGDGHDPRPGDTEGRSAIRGARNPRRGRERRGGDLPRPVISVPGRELAQRCGKGARAPERRATSGSAPRGLSNGKERCAMSALIAAPGLACGGMIAPLVVAGIGASMAMPAPASSVVGAVRHEDVRKAAGANSMLRELGGEFGIALLVTVFAAADSYASPDALSDGFAPAIAVSAALSHMGAIAGLSLPGRPQATRTARRPRPIPALAPAGGAERIRLEFSPTTTSHEDT